MQKNECIHVHRLLVLVFEHAHERGDVPREAFERYRDRHVKPSAAHRSKQCHTEAVQFLASTLATAVPRPDERAARPLAE